MRFSAKHVAPANFREPEDPEADLTQRRNRMLRWLMLVGGLLLVLSCLWLSEVHGYAVVLGKEIPLRAQAHGQVLWVIESGVRVASGDRVIELDATETRLVLEEAEAELEAARAEVEFEKRELEQRLAELRARQDEVRVQVAQASETVALRGMQLELDGYLSKKADLLFEDVLVSEIDRAKMNHAEKATQLGIQKGSEVLSRRAAQLRRMSDVVDAHFRLMAQRERLAEARVARLESKRDRYRRLVERAVVRSPVSGVVSARHVSSGADAKLGDVIVSILDPSELSVAVFVPEAELSNLSLALHEQVKVRFNSHPLRGVSAQVVEEYASVAADPVPIPGGLDRDLLLKEGLVLASRVEMAQNCPFELRPGMTGTVQLGRRGYLWPLQSAASGMSRALGL